jgi:hypothetical protein
LCEVSQVRKLVTCFSSCELWKFFVFIFWNFKVFNFPLVILKFHMREIMFEVFLKI